VQVPRHSLSLSLPVSASLISGALRRLITHRRRRHAKQRNTHKHAGRQLINISSAHLKAKSDRFCSAGEILGISIPSLIGQV